MMQATKPWHRYTFPGRTCLIRSFPSLWRLFVQAEMGSILVIVADVFPHQPFEMMFIEDDHVVEQIVATGTDEPLGDTVLPWTLEASSFGLNAKALDCFNDFVAEVTSAVEEHVVRR
jgi:hypothetical protein